MKKCVAYCRVSTDSTEQATSIENQKAHYMELFRRDGYSPANIGLLYRKDGTSETLQGIFADEGITGTSLKHRRAFKYMLELAYKKEFDVIYTKSISRFARSVEDGVKTLKDLKVLGVEVRFETENLSSLDPASEMVINLLMSMAQEESRTKSQNVKWGIRQLQKKGGTNTPAGYGYDKENGFLKVNAQEAEIVKLVYKLYLEEGYGTGKICRYLNSKKIPTKKGKMWRQHQIVDILRNKLFIGKLTTHTKETADVNRKTVKYLDEDEWIVTYNEDLRIISDETFKAVQLEKERRLNKLKTGVRTSNAHLLSNILYCGNCGGPLKRKKRKSYVRKDGTSKDLGHEWTCQYNDMYGKDKCEHRNQVIEVDFIEELKQEILALKKRDMQGVFDVYYQLHFNYDTSEDKLNKLEKEKGKLNKKVDLNFELFSESEIDKEEYKRRNKMLRDELENVQRNIDKILNIEREIEKVQYQYKQFKHYLATIDVDKLTNTQLKKIFKKVRIKHFGNLKKSTIKTIDYDYYFLDFSVDELMEVIRKEDLMNKDELLGKLELSMSLFGAKQYA